MSIAITEDHRALADTASDFLRKRDARGAARALLEADRRSRRPTFWDDLAELGWLGLHVPEEHGGSGFGLRGARRRGRGARPRGRARPVRADGDRQRGARGRRRPTTPQGGSLPGLADGSTCRRASRSAATVELRDGAASRLGRRGARRRAGRRPAGRASATTSPSSTSRRAASTVEVPPNLDPTRRSARVTLDGAPADRARRARGRCSSTSPASILAAEAVGVARECTELAAEYAKVREQFGRPIAMFQAVKHHCANMLVATELATAAVWDAARAADAGGDQFVATPPPSRRRSRCPPPTCAPTSTSRCTAASASPGSTTRTSTCAGRPRSTSILDAERRGAATSPTSPARGVRRARTVDLPPEAEPIRDEVRAFAERHQGPRRRRRSATR